MDKPVMTPEGDLLLINVVGDGASLTAPLAREPVRQSDILPMRDETWLQGLRRGQLCWNLSSLDMQCFPVRQEGNAMLKGMILELGLGQQRVRRVFPPRCFTLTLERALVEPLRSGVLQATSDIRYWLSCEPAGSEWELAAQNDPWSAAGAAGVKVRVSPPKWKPEPARLADYLEASEPLLERAATEQGGSDEVSPTHPWVFFRPEAWEQGRQMAFRNGSLEAAAVFTGWLMQDTESPEISVVVEACIAAEHAEEKEFSVMPTGESWSSIHEVLNRRRRRLNRPHEIIVGSVHGHPFPPGADEDGNRRCGDCVDRATCRKTTAASSVDDLRWHRSVFTGQPWSILAIWGWNAREEEVWQVYGLAGGALVPRGVRVLSG